MRQSLPGEPSGLGHEVSPEATLSCVAHLGKWVQCTSWDVMAQTEKWSGSCPRGRLSVGSVEYTPGQFLRRETVEDLCAMNDWVVVVKEAKS